MILPPPPTFTLFPYTTLFRSDDIMRSYYFLREQNVRIRFGPGRHPTSGAMFLYFEGPDGMKHRAEGRMKARSEEHSSELQSHSDLVCRLLLEKKNKD